MDLSQEESRIKRQDEYAEWHAFRHRPGRDVYLPPKVRLTASQELWRQGYPSESIREVHEQLNFEAWFLAEYGLTYAEHLAAWRDSKRVFFKEHWRG